MPFFVPVSSYDKKDFPKQLPQRGRQRAYCISIVDIGMHVNPKYGKNRRRLILSFELPDDPIQAGPHAGKPFVISKEFTASLDEKSDLRNKLVQPVEEKSLTDDEAKAYDICQLLGRPMELVIHHKNKINNPSEKTYEILNFLSVPERDLINFPKCFHEPYLFDLNNFDKAVFDKLPEWVQKKINKEDVKFPTSSPKPFE
jgi:hypothetical protein